MQQVWQDNSASSRGRVFAPPAAALLPAADQDDQRQINREDLKGHVVDLSRINQPVELEDLRKVVAEAVDLVAIRKEAWVLVHPGDDWTRHIIDDTIGPAIKLRMVADAFGDGVDRAFGTNHTNNYNTFFLLSF